MFFTPFREGAYGRGCRVEDGDFVSVDDLPETVGAGVVGSAFVHEGGGSVSKDAVNDVAVSGHPSDVGGTPIGVFFFEVKDVFRGEVGSDHVSAGGVEDAFGLAGGAGGVEYVERVFGVEGCRFAYVRGVGHDVVPPVVAALFHGDVVFGTFYDDNVFYGRAVFECFVDGGFERDDTAASPSAVCGDDAIDFGIVNALDDGVCGESAKYDGVDGADACAGEHCDGKLGNHRHVDSDAVAFFDVECFESVCESTDASVQFLVGEDDLVAGLAFPDDGGFVLASGIEVPVEAVVADVCLSAFEPFVEWWIVVVEDFVPFFEPVEFAGDVAPEGFGIIDGFLVHLVVLFAGCDVRLGDEFFGWLENARFFQDMCDWVTHGFLLLRRYGRVCPRAHP